MKNLNIVEIFYLTGCIDKRIIENVTVVNKEKIVRKKERKFDLLYGHYYSMSNLDKILDITRNQYNGAKFKQEIIGCSCISFHEINLDLMMLRYEDWKKNQLMLLNEKEVEIINNINKAKKSILED